MKFGNWETRVLLLSALLILDLGLIILLTRRSEVTYEQASQVNNIWQLAQSGSSDLPEYLFCLPLKGEFELFPNRTEIDLDEELLTYFQIEKFEQERKEKLGTQNRTKLRGDFQDLPHSHAYKTLVLEQLKTSNYYFVNERICFIGLPYSYFKYRSRALKQFFPSASLFVYKKATHDLYEMSSPDQNFDQVVVVDREQPYSNCAKNYTKHRCLNECFRARKWLSRYFYDGNETGSIVLDWTGEEKSVREHERTCYDECDDDSCKSTYFVPAFSQRELTITTYTAFPLIAKFDFWLQLTGLLLPVVAILLLQFGTKLIERRAFQVALLCTCLLSGLLIFSALYRHSYPPVDDCGEETPKVPTKKQITFRLLEPEPFSMLICVGIGNIIRDKYFLNIGDRNDPENLRNEFKQFYLNKTWSELEQDTENGFEDTVERVYMQFLDRAEEVDWSLSPRILFLSNYQNTLARCFQIDVNPREPAYRAMLGITRVVIKFKHSEQLFALLPNHTTSYQNLQFDSTSYRRIEKHSKSGDCLDYQQAYPYCGSQQSCVEACVSRQLLDNSGRIVEKGLIDKAHYNASQWNETKIEGFLEKVQIPKRLNKLCQSRFNRIDCISTTFGRVEKDDRFLWRRKEINIYYDLVKEFEYEDHYQTPGLYFSLLIVQGVFLALNLLRLAVVVGFLEFKVRKIRLCNRLIQTVCLVILFVHLICAFRAAMNAEPVLSQHYESPSSLQMNDAVFCFGMRRPDVGNSSLAMATNSTANRTEESNSFNLTTNDHNPSVDDGDTVGLTGTLLEEWSSDLTPETVFDKISYLDKSSGEWVTLDFSTDNYTNPDLLIDSFFYQTRKCFAINPGFDYSRHQFASLQQQNTEVLRVQFSESFKMDKNLTLSIAMKWPFSMQFDSLFHEVFFRRKFGENEFRDKVYAISQRELVKITYEDHFYWVNPLVFLFQGEPDLNHYFMRLREAFKAKYQSTTLNLPLQEDEFDLSINDTLFEQFYEEYVHENGPPIDREHPEMEFAVNEMKESYRETDYEFDLTFSVAFLKKIVKQSNAGAYLEFVAYLLNALLVLVVIGLFDLFIHQIC